MHDGFVFHLLRLRVIGPYMLANLQGPNGLLPCDGGHFGGKGTAETTCFRDVFGEIFSSLEGSFTSTEFLSHAKEYRDIHPCIEREISRSFYFLPCASIATQRTHIVFHSRDAKEGIHDIGTRRRHRGRIIPSRRILGSWRGRGLIIHGSLIIIGNRRLGLCAIKKTRPAVIGTNIFHVNGIMPRRIGHRLGISSHIGIGIIPSGIAFHCICTAQASTGWIIIAGMIVQQACRAI